MGETQSYLNGDVEEPVQRERSKKQEWERPAARAKFWALWGGQPEHRQTDSCKTGKYGSFTLPWAEFLNLGWHFDPGNSLQLVQSCLLASQASIPRCYYICSSSCDNPKYLQTLPWGMKSPLIENHWSRGYWESRVFFCQKPVYWFLPIYSYQIVSSHLRRKRRTHLMSEKEEMWLSSKFEENGIGAKYGGLTPLGRWKKAGEHWGASWSWKHKLTKLLLVDSPFYIIFLSPHLFQQS